MRPIPRSPALSPSHRPTFRWQSRFPLKAAPAHSAWLHILGGLLLTLLHARAESAPNPEAKPPSPQFRAAAAPPRPASENASAQGQIAASTPAQRLSGCLDSDLEFLADFLRDNLPPTVEIGSKDRESLARTLSELGESVQILEQTEVRAEQESPFHADLPQERVGYLRLGSMTPDHVSALETALGGMLERKIPAMVLDLRATGPVADPECLAQLCRLFCTKGKVLFRLRPPRLQETSIFTSKQDPVFRGPLVILVGPDTGGAAEAAAAVLRGEAQALIAGSKTAGKRAAYVETTLTAGLTVRVAAGTFECALSTAETAPDLPAEASASETRILLAAGLQRTPAELIREPHRPRLNEAALVAGLNPELDAGRQNTKNGRPPLPLDTALQRAVDFCATLVAFSPQEQPQRRQKNR